MRLIKKNSFLQNRLRKFEEKIQSDFLKKLIFIDQKKNEISSHTNQIVIKCLNFRYIEKN